MIALASPSRPTTSSAASGSPPKEHFEDISPIDGAVIAEVSRGGADEADAAVRPPTPRSAPGPRSVPPAARRTCTGSRT